MAGEATGQGNEATKHTVAGYQCKPVMGALHAVDGDDGNDESTTKARSATILICWFTYPLNRVKYLLRLYSTNLASA